jgi:hypothetical protein
MINSIVLVAAILAGSGMVWIVINRTRAEGRKAYQPIEIHTDDLRHRTRGRW